jgi:uncharacterized protein YdeI (YjbR/CyaY-like superfamily)
VNRDHIARLTAAGRMRARGQREVDAAKADGRWEAAQAPIRTLTVKDVPPDLLKAIKASPRAAIAFKMLKRTELVGLIFQTAAMKSSEGRARKIGELVSRLERRKTS